MARDDDFDLNFDDFDDFDFDDGSNKKELDPKSRKPIARVLAGTKKGLKRGVKDKDLIKKTVLRALPKNVSASINKAENVKDYAEDLYNKSMKDLDPLITSGADFLEKNLGSIKGKLPKSVEKRLQKIADTKSSKAKRRSGSKSQAQYQNEEIFQQFTEIFANQVLGDDKESKLERKEKKVELKADKAYKNLSTSLLNGIYESTRTIVKQNEGTTTRYRKAMLEANLRQLYVQKDILQAIQKSHQDQLNALNVIVKNSALPEAVKIQKDEMLSDLLKRRTMGAIADSAQSYTRNYFKNVGKKITANVRGTTGSLGMMGSMLGMGDMGMDNRDVFTKGGEDFVAPMILDVLSSKLGSAARSRLMKNKKIKGFDDKLGYLNDTLPYQLMEWARKPDDDQLTLDEMLNGESYSKILKRGAKGLAKDYLKGFKPQTGFRTDSIADLQAPQSPTRKTNKATEEVIPGYLARILQSVERTRLGTTNVPLVQYDYSRNAFSTAKGVTKSVRNLLMDKDKISGVNSNLDSIVESLGGSNLSPEARTLLKKQLMRDSMDARRVSPEDYADIKRFSMGNANSPEAQELAKFFEGKKGQLTPEEMTRLQRRVNSIGFDSSELRTGVQQLANIGYTDEMAKLGIVRKGINGQNNIDYDAVINRYIGNERGGNPVDTLREELAKQTEAVVAAAQQTNELLNESIVRQEIELGSNGINGLGIGSRSINERLKNLSNDASGKKKSMYNRLRNTLGKATNTVAPGMDVKGIGNNIRNVVGGKIKRIGEQLKDFYIPGRTEPLLRMSDILSGMYIDATTKKTIFSVSDIKGTIVDRTGNIIANVNQLVNAETLDGQRLKGITADSIESASGMAATGIEALKMAAAKLMENNDIDRDLFIPGEINPRISLVKLQNGEYFSPTGKLIKKYSDTKDGVIEKRNGLPVQVVTKNDIASKGLVDVEGKQMVRPMSAIIGKIKSGFDTGKRMLGGLKNGIKGLPKNIRGMFGRKGGNLSEEQADNVQVGLLQNLYGLMESRLPQPKEIRKGSYEWLMGNRGGKDRKSSRDGRLDKDAKILGIGKDADGSLSIGSMLMKGLGILTGILTGIKSLGSILEVMKRFLPGGSDMDLPDIDVDRKGKKKIGRKGAKGLGKKMAGVAAEKAAENAAKKAATKQAGKAGAKLIGKQALKWGGRALAGVAIAGGAVLSAPVALTVGVGLALWTAYDVVSDVYKYLKDRRAYLTKLRMLQYGVELGDSDSLEKIIKIENGIEKSGGKISGQELLKQSISIFKIEGDEKKIPYLQTWLVNRFLPVYNAHQTAVTANGGKKVTDADDSVSIEKKMTFVQSIDSACPNIWGYKALPLESDTHNSMIVQKEYQNTLQEAKEYYTAKQKEVPLSTKTVTPQSRAGAQLSTSAAPDKGFSGGGGGTGTGPTSAAINSTSKALKFDLKNVAQMPSTMTAITSIRLKTYGIVDLADDVNVGKFLSLEKAAVKYIALTSNDIVFQSEYGKFLSENLSLLGIVENNADAVNSALAWIEKRFIPTLISYCGLIYAATKTTSEFLEAESKLKPAQAVALAVALIGTREFLNNGRSVWSISSSPIPGYKLNDDAGSTDQHIRFLQSKVNQKTLKTESAKLKAEEIRRKRTGESSDDDESTGQLGSAGKAFQKSYQDTVGRTPDTFMDKVSGAAASVWEGTKSIAGKAAGAVKDFVGYSDTGTQTVDIKGLGGKISELRYDPKNPNGWSNLKDLIVSASKMAGVDPGLMAAKAAIESNFKASVKAGTSSATGLYQFTKGTWKSMVLKYGAQYGIGPEYAAPEYRSNPAMSALMAAEYVKENSKFLAKSIGRNPTAVDLYTAHFLGAGGSRALLSAPDDALAKDVLGADQVNANRTVFNQGGRWITVGEFKNWVKKRIFKDNGKYFNEARQAAGLPSSDAGGGIVSATPSATTAEPTSSSSSNAAMPGTGPTTPSAGTPAPSFDILAGTGIPSKAEAPGGAGPLASLGKQAPATPAATPTTTTTPTYNDAQTRSESSAYNTGPSSMETTNKILTDNQAILNNIAMLVEKGVNYVLANGKAVNPATPGKDSANTSQMDTKPVVDMKRSF